jgi:hypothetical protein
MIDFFLRSVLYGNSAGAPPPNQTTEDPAAAEFRRLYDQEYDHNMRGTVAKMNEIFWQERWDINGLPGPRPVTRGAIGPNELTVIYQRALEGLGPDDGGNPPYHRR